MLRRQLSKEANPPDQYRLDPALLSARGLSILTVVESVKASNLILPSGNIKAGNLDYNVFTNNQFRTVEPFKRRNREGESARQDSRVRDIGTVTDSSDIQTNIFHADRARSVFLRVNNNHRNTVEVVDALRHSCQDVGYPGRSKTRYFVRSVTLYPQSIHNPIVQTLHGSLLAAA